MQSASITNIPSSHSLSADMATGWRPKMKIIGPMPLNFDNLKIDKKIQSVISSGASISIVSYLGPRPTNTFNMHNILNRQYKYKYQHLLCSNYTHLKAFFHKFYQRFEPVTKRNFTGMSPYHEKHTLIFDSCFQSGNLDCAIKIRQNQYDLVLRVDSNTIGHVQWYYFTVENPQNSKKIVKFNIVNFRKNKSCYDRGMRPYVKRDGQWAQEGQNFQKTQSSIRFGNESISTCILSSQNQIINFYRKVSFELSFQAKQKLEIAYCIPYTYSKLQAYLKEIKQITEHDKQLMLEIDYSAESLSGLEIPVVKITEKEKDQECQKKQKKLNKKYCICIIGRQHPGQANSSYVIEGIINQLLQKKQQMKNLLRYCEFVIIPMMNPDGVVAGNFRTSLYGKDLNRLFKSQSAIDMIPEVQLARKIIHNAYLQYKGKLLMFLDIHGHSVRRNSFAYGPGIFGAKNIVDVRIFPKLISNETEIFRFPSCSFRMSEDKKFTARALFSKYAAICYTIETSNWSYNLKKNPITFNFGQSSWKQVGQGISRAIHEYIAMKRAERQRKIKRKNKGSVAIKSISTEKHIMNHLNQNNKKNYSKYHLTTQISEITSFPQERTRYFMSKQQQLDKTEEQKQEKDNFGDQFIIQQKEVQQNQSDNISDTGFDSESSDQDMEKQKFKQYFNAASKMIIEFQKAFYGQSYKKNQRKQVKPEKLKKPMTMQKKTIETLACLRNNFRNITISKQLGQKKLQPTTGSIFNELDFSNYRAKKKQSIPLNKQQKKMSIFPIIQSTQQLPKGQKVTSSTASSRIQGSIFLPKKYI